MLDEQVPIFQPGLKNPSKNQYLFHKGLVVVKLTQGQHMLIDIEDIDILKEHVFYTVKKNRQYYAQCTEEGKKEYIHRMIMNNPKDLQIDHINRNGLNNCRYNLRVVTHQQNMQNCSLRLDNTSGYKGISYNKKRKRYIAYFYMNEKRIQKQFSEKKNKNAKELAIEWRKEMERLYSQT